MTIENVRVEIAGILTDEPSLKSRMPELWEECFEAATRLAQKETHIKFSSKPTLMAGCV
ncbi:MAG: DUF29 domain-containing protein [Desulfobacteraceae bacterium]|nr:DUF29 domain-containing protein [Desulfobacteraceae bacterium]